MKSTTTTSTLTWILNCLLATAILLFSSWLYRSYQPLWQGTGLAVIQLPVPLNQFPMQLPKWQGVDLEIHATTEAYMRANFADDFFSRRYINNEKTAWADVYVVYCASRPSGILGHRPRVCYVGNGWNHDGTEGSTVVSLGGREIPCLIHRFYRPAPDYRETVVLSFYMANGTLTRWEGDFEATRRPNTEGDFARYVAQVQISSATENLVREAAAALADWIIAYLPDEQGIVRAAQDQIVGSSGMPKSAPVMGD